MLERLSLENKAVHSFRLMRNFGKSGALLCGLHQAKGQFILTMDDDLEHLPEEIPLLISKQNHDVVIAAFKKKNHPLLKRITSSLNAILETLLIRKPFRLVNGPFRLLNARVVKSLLAMETPYPFISAMIFYSSDDCVNVEVKHGKRLYHKSGFTSKKVLQNFSNLLINNSNFILRKMAMIGLLLSFFGMVGFCFCFFGNCLFERFSNESLMLLYALCFIGGIITFSMGVMGEYLSRLIRIGEKKPAFILREQAKKI